MTPDEIRALAFIAERQRGITLNHSQWLQNVAVTLRAYADHLLPYDRQILVEILIYHQRRDSQHCSCGWGKLGMSHAEHVADIYEESVQARNS